VITHFESGAGKVALDGALALDGSTFEPTLITGPQGGTRAEGSGLDVVRIPELAAGDLAAFRSLARLLREGDYDVVHTHGTGDRRSGLIGRAAAARAGVPRVVHTWHGLPFNDFQSWAERRSRLALERLAARHTHAFLAVGSGTASSAIRLGLAGPDRIRVCWPAVDAADRSAASGTGSGRWAQARRRLDLPLGVKVVGAVGGLTPQKGPDVFVRALARLPADVHGLWAGEGPLLGRLVRLTARLGLADRVHWLGHRDDIAELLPAFDAMAVPSRWEGLPAVLLEAVVAGVPVVTTAVASHHDLVLPRETGLLVPPDRPVELAVALQWILEHPEAAREMADAARTLLGLAGRHTPAHLGAVLADCYGPAHQH
jgi:glycosyltransferase involved in cell wall biosynthesis